MKKFLEHVRNSFSSKKGCPCKKPLSRGELKARIKSETYHIMNTLHKGMSRGAEDIYRMISTQGKWGNKQLWGFREKGRGKKSH